MEEVESQTDLCGIESGVFLGKPPLPLHVEHEISAAHKLYDEEESGRRLEAGVQTHQEGVVGGRLKDVLLGLHPVNVLKENNNTYRQGRTSSSTSSSSLLYVEMLCSMSGGENSRNTSSSVTSVFLMTFMA